MISNSQTLKGGATLFFTTLTLVLFPKAFPDESFSCVDLLISSLTDA